MSPPETSQVHYTHKLNLYLFIFVEICSSSELAANLVEIKMLEHNEASPGLYATFLPHGDIDPECG